MMFKTTTNCKRGIEACLFLVLTYIFFRLFINDDSKIEKYSRRLSQIAELNTSSFSAHRRQYYTIKCPSLKENVTALLWDKTTSDWFNIHAINISSKDNNVRFGTVSLHPEIIKALKNHHQKIYKELALSYHTQINQFYMSLKAWISDISTGHDITRYAIFNDVAITTNGIVISKRSCKVARSGGCLSSTKLKRFSKSLPMYESVVSISAFWGHGVWHFPMEALVGLKAISYPFADNITIHISAKTPYAISWLNLIGIHEKNIISNDIMAKRLIVPELGRCGNPFLSQIKWLQKTINMKTPSTRDTLVLIKRTKRRKMTRFDEIEFLSAEHAKKYGLHMIIHNDANLPSLSSQLELYSKAKIVIGPHGAGFVNLIATAPGTCVVEFLPMEVNLCYMRLSYILGLKYLSIPLYGNKSIAFASLSNALKGC